MIQKLEGENWESDHPHQSTKTIPSIKPNSSIRQKDQDLFFNRSFKASNLPGGNKATNDQISSMVPHQRSQEQQQTSQPVFKVNSFQKHFIGFHGRNEMNIKSSARPFQKLPSWTIAEKDNQHLNQDHLKNMKTIGNENGQNISGIVQDNSVRNIIHQSNDGLSNPLEQSYKYSPDKPKINDQND